jgi:uncharacterized protein with von Willebrand factor type A (vWA) domain
MHPFGGLPENLASFCALLRRDHGFRIGSGELISAAHTLEIVGVSDPNALRHALRPVLSATRDEAAVFDEAFNRFFLPRESPAAPDRESMLRRERGTRAGGQDVAEDASRAADPSAAIADDVSDSGSARLAPIDAGEDDGASRLARASYSPIEAESADRPELAVVEDAWIQAARSLVRRIHVGLSRKWRPVAKGRRFDLRRTLRSSLQTGGEALAPRWLGRPRRTPRFVLLIDGSRSMGEYAHTALTVAAALARATSRVEVFTFSTAIQRVTSEVRGAARGTTRRLPRLEYAWGGGTSIGACFAEFLRRFGERLIDTDTIVIVASDGLDVGEPDVLRAAMRELARRSASLVWLNPLLETPGYEPTALGMSTARPFVSTLSSVNDLAGFVRLSRSVRVRA